MPSTTVSLNNVAEGLVSSGFVSRGDRVLTTDQEHAGGLRCWQHYSPKGRQPLLAALDVVSIPVMPPPETPSDILALFKAALDAHEYKVVAVSHVTTTNGLVLPIKQLAGMVHSHGAILVVDGAQAHGGIAVDVHDLGVDAYATSAHKWLLAPKGSGLLYISQAISAHVSSTRFDDGYVPYSGSSGTRPMHTIYGLGQAIEYMEAYGFAEVEQYNLALRKKAYAELALLGKEVPGLNLVR